MDLIELYKKHINSNPDGLELYEFFDKFAIEPIVWHYNPKIKQHQELREEIKRTEAIKWIFKHSKL